MNVEISVRRVFYLAALFIIGIGAAWVLWDGFGRGALKSASAIGGPFKLVSDDGAMVTEDDLEGVPVAMTFGFTHCPDVCPTTLGEYLSAFDGRIVGLTGTPQAVTAMTKLYKVYSRKIAVHGDDYMMDHTAGIYLFDSGGRFRGLITPTMNSDVALKKLREIAG